MRIRRFKLPWAVGLVLAAALLAIVPAAATFSAFSATTSVHSVFAAQSVFPPDNLSAPSFSGTAQAGQTLTAATGSWSRSPSSYRYQWQRCPADGQASCSAISSATANTYAVAGIDAGYRLRLAVRAHNAGGDSAATISGSSAVVPPAEQRAPTISGPPAVGQPLTASVGTWLGVGNAYAIQWRRCDVMGATCTDITGAIGSTYTPTSGDRHETIVALVTATGPSGAAATASTAPTNPIAASANPIVTENQLPGTTAWQIKGNPSTAIAGYTSEMSVQPGDILHMHVSSNGNARYRVEIYRLGWYGGDGGRLITCIPSCASDEAGAQYSAPAPDPSTGQLDAGWPITDTATVGSDWTSGYFISKLVVTSGQYAGQASYIPFIVRAPPGSSSTILVQASVNTWEAYNNWGGKSLYPFNSTSGAPATMVSFNRPFAYSPNAATSNTTPLAWEYQLAAFLEREGYDVSYQTDVDTDQNPASLLAHKLDIVSGHDEYWSGAMRNAWEAARTQGVNLAFIGGNIGYWQMRYADSSDRTVVEYRVSGADPETDPTQKTVPFQQLASPRPECTLLGIEYQGGLAEANGGPYDLTVQSAASSSAWFQGSGLTPGVTLSSTVGYEWDAIKPGCAVPTVQDLLHWQAGSQTADAVMYQAASGATVFSDGTLNLVYSLNNYGQTTATDPRVQTLFGNVLDGLSTS